MISNIHNNSCSTLRIILCIYSDECALHLKKVHVLYTIVLGIHLYHGQGENSNTSMQFMIT